MIAQEFPPSPGGIGSYVYCLSKKLLERGYTITVITRGSAGKTVRESVDGIDVFKVSFFPFYPFHIKLHGLFVGSLLNWLEPSLTLVHLHTPLPPPIKTSLPVMTTVHTPMKVDARFHEVLDPVSLAERLQSMFLYPPIESKLFGLSEKITTVSWSVAKELGEYGVDTRGITVVGNGVDEETFIPTRNKEDREKYVLYTGILRARKGLFDLVECARYVCDANLNVRFVICGTGPFLRTLEKKVRRLGLDKKVVFLGYVQKEMLIQLYQNATLHVTPSHYEGLPTVVLEAMACGLPEVATKVGGNSEIIINDVNGYLVPPRSPREMADVILRLLADSALRERIGRAARETIVNRFSWDKIADNVQRCYDSLIPRAR
jgi:glycosyltransferase involved in cell wall biosynthesis